MSLPITIGNSNYIPQQPHVKGKYISLHEESYYCIENYDAMPSFFMSIVSSADHWIFISSTGGLTAGRINAESALFPYDTDDKVTENHATTGTLSIFWVTRGDTTSLWEPFFDRYAGIYNLERKLYKNITGDKLVFEETNHDLELTCRQAWRTGDRFGFVLTTWLHNRSNDPVNIRLLAGAQNLLPYGVTSQTQSTFSNLLNAYKRSELIPGAGLGIFTLSSTLTDLAEPSESLMATTAWQVGLENPTYLLSSNQVNSFRNGAEITTETDVRGFRGAYLLNTEITLAPNAEKDWSLAFDVNQDSADIDTLLTFLKNPPAQQKNALEEDILQGSQALEKIIASADGLQISGNPLNSAHHYANVLFNTMRGGIFANNYQVDKVDFLDFLRTRNKTVLEKHADFFAKLLSQFEISDLLIHASQSNDPDLERLCFEYLPLTFSRRHGDPSRPWNKFSINIKNADGSQRLDYQGNWRDIFQNWEALLVSYPEFIESIIATFVNAGTPDGYNPYRVTRAGVEWEVPEPGNPWANIGYWSDHQIIYLEKLLELSARYHPDKLHDLLNKKIFSYVNVPYRIKAYADLLDDPYKTIDFDFDTNQAIEEKITDLGSDAKLVQNANGGILHVTLAEKLLILLLAKLVNFVPEGGIWMNTQRPEWNDANNALVGKGLSVVTLGYLRRYIVFLEDLLDGLDETTLDVTQDVKALFDSIASILSDHLTDLSAPLSDLNRRGVMDALGQAGSDYRLSLYEQGFCEQTETVSVPELKTFLATTRQHIEHSLQANRRADGLYHAYNILKLGKNTAEIEYLYEMLEGQVSILSSGFLSPKEALALLRQLRTSALYRADQHSYILYPDRDLPSFVTKNRLTADDVSGIGLVQTLIQNNETSLLVRDGSGAVHFNGTFRNARDVRHALKKLGAQPSYKKLVEADSAKILALFEKVFQHDSFTGRSGTFFAYEGLGSIYWHMISKLLLAVQENYLLAINQGAETETIQGLADFYYDVRQGLGFNKSPDVYGAFPTDPYSHTPKGQGAKQPGMTGQVKEEILTRLVELGLFVEHGQIRFDPVLLRDDEFVTQPTPFKYVDLAGNPQQLELPAGSLAFTFCQTPIIYQPGQKDAVHIHYADGSMETVSGLELNTETSQHIFKRDGIITKIVVTLS